MIRHVFFDLDNTLYPSTSPMEGDIVRRMNEYTAGFLGTTPEEAARLRKTEMPKYGTTLEWLMAERGLTDIDGYFACVHPEGEEDCLEPDPGLAPFLSALGTERYVLTNAPMEHAERVLRRLGIEGLFSRVYDIRFNGWKGKPDPKAFERVLSDAGAGIADSAFLDDMPRYVKGFSDFGGLGILMDHEGRHPDPGMPVIKSIYELPAALARERSSG